MRDPLYGNSLDEVIVAASIAAGVLFLIWVVRAFARHRYKHARTTTSDLDDFLLDLAGRTKLFLLFFPAVFLGARALDKSPDVHRLLRMVAALSLIMQLALWTIGFIDVWIRRYRRTRIETDPAAVMTVHVFRIAAVFVIWAIAIVAALHNVGFNVTTLIAGLGIGGIAVALATQNMLADLFASLSIVIDKPFILGDAISVDKDNGTVEHIGLKTTRVRAAGGEELIFANADLLKSRIRNYRRMSERRSLTKITVAFTTSAETLARIPLLMRSAVEKQREVRFDRAHLVGFGETGYLFELVFFVPAGSYSAYLDVQQAVQLDVIRALAAEQVEMTHRHAAG
jgi:small-conductance mechanosensitive channel